jgi:uncharacterized membrane protein
LRWTAPGSLRASAAGKSPYKIAGSLPWWSGSPAGSSGGGVGGTPTGSFGGGTLSGAGEGTSIGSGCGGISGGSGGRVGSGAGSDIMVVCAPRARLLWIKSLIAAWSAGRGNDRGSSGVGRLDGVVRIQIVGRRDHPVAPAETVAQGTTWARRAGRTRVLRRRPIQTGLAWARWSGCLGERWRQATRADKEAKDQEVGKLAHALCLRFSRLVAGGHLLAPSRPVSVDLAENGGRLSCPANLMSQIDP